MQVLRVSVVAASLNGRTEAASASPDSRTQGAKRRCREAGAGELDKAATT